MRAAKPQEGFSGGKKRTLGKNKIYSTKQEREQDLRAQRNLSVSFRLMKTGFTPD